MPFRFENVVRYVILLFSLNCIGDQTRHNYSRSFRCIQRKPSDYGFRYFVRKHGSMCTM